MRLVAALALMAAFSACNTVHGVGKDVQAGGRVLSDSAETVRRQLP